MLRGLTADTNMLLNACVGETEEPTFPPPGWCFMLSVEPILERTLRMSGAGAVAGRAVAFGAVVVVEEAARGTRGTGGFFSGTVPAVEDGVAGLAAVVRAREAAVVGAVLRVVVVVVGGALGLAELARRERGRGFFPINYSLNMLKLILLNILNTESLAAFTFRNAASVQHLHHLK